MAKRRGNKPKPQAMPAAAPLAAVDRLGFGGMMAFGGMTGASQMARSPRFSNWRPQLLDADGQAEYELPDLRAFSRDLERTAPVAAGAIETRVSHIVGTGLKLQSLIDAKELGMTEKQASEWQSLTERRFGMWAKSRYADRHGELCFYKQQQLLLRSHDSSGDVFAILGDKGRDGWPFRLTVQIVEADRVSNKDGRMNTATMIDGVERDEDGEPVAIWVAKHHPGRIIARSANEWERIPYTGQESGRRNVLHLKEMKRPGQTRGLPILAPIIATIKQLTRYTDAEVDAAVNSAALALFLEMDGETFADQTIFSDAEREKVLAAAGGWDGTIESGRAVNLMPGEKINSPTPGRPNPNFDPFFGAMLNICSIGLGIPKEVLSKAFNASYSASRAALMDAWRTWQIKRTWLAQDICQPIYEEWLADAVALGIIQAPGFFADPFIRYAWSQTSWCGDGPGALDPLKEAMAAGKRMEIGLTNRAVEVVAYDGGDWETRHRQSAKEMAARLRDGLEAPLAGPPAAIAVPPPDPNETTD